MELLFKEKLTENAEAFAAKVVDIAKKLQINPNWLMLVMKHESGLNSHLANSIGAIGLIQFLPSTFGKWGLSADEMKSMSNVKQLDYVYQFYQPGTGKFKSYADLHMYAFFPAAAGQNQSYVFKTDTISASKIASQNAPFDLNKNGEITKGEADTYFNAFVDKMKKSGELPEKFAKDFNSNNINSNTTMDKILNIAKAAAIAVLAIVLIYEAYKSIKG